MLPVRRAHGRRQVTRHSIATSAGPCRCEYRQRQEHRPPGSYSAPLLMIPVDQLLDLRQEVFLAE
jgi:hypothetical protein